MILDVQIDDDGPIPQSEHFKYLCHVLGPEQFDEWTIRRLDWWLQNAGENFRLEKRHPGTLGPTTPAAVLNVCKALVADGRHFEKRLAEVSTMPELNFRLFEAHSLDVTPTEAAFSLWQRDIEAASAKLSELMRSAERLTAAAQERGSKGGRPKQTERNEIFVAFCAHLRSVKANASHEFLASIAVQVFPRYVPGGAFSQEAALKILRNKLPKRPTQRKKPSSERPG